MLPQLRQIASNNSHPPSLAAGMQPDPAHRAHRNYTAGNLPDISRASWHSHFLPVLPSRPSLFASLNQNPYWLTKMLSQLVIMNAAHITFEQFLHFMMVPGQNKVRREEKQCGCQVRGDLQVGRALAPCLPAACIGSAEALGVAPFPGPSSWPYKLTEISVKGPCI